MVAVTNLAILQSQYVTPTNTGLHFAPDTPYHEWEQAGRLLWEMRQWINWAIGDWLNFGERAYGEAYAQGLDATGWDYQRLADCAWVARAVPFSVRNENLSWTHHRYVARFKNPDLQRQELSEAERYQYTTREFRQILKADYPPDKQNHNTPAQPEMCECCGQPLRNT